MTRYAGHIECANPEEVKDDWICRPLRMCKPGGGKPLTSLWFFITSYVTIRPHQLVVLLPGYLRVGSFSQLDTIPALFSSHRSVLRRSGFRGPF